ncbi:MAG: hypothetical protein KBF25_05730 [Chitinophagaceae bacterium]|nr:hypothetical protein [Chitinophagaceae bacterium]
MQKLFLLLSLFIFCSLVKAANTPDTVVVGVYINSVHDIDFKEKQYTINLWLWLKYKNPDFDFSKYLEVPLAKSVDKSFFTIDTLKDGRIYMLLKLQCVMKDSWQIEHFPFDRQKLRFSIENSQYDSADLIFVEDTVGKHYSKWVTSGWNIITDSFKISTNIKKYETAFGDPELIKPKAEFSAFRVFIGIERDSWWLFLKLFIGMYLSFFLSFLCFFIHIDNIDSRFNLSVGSLFAVIGNKYVIDSALPESTSFTLVDTLHGLTLFFVFAVVACSAYSLNLVKLNRIEHTKRFDKSAAWILFAIYLILNLWFIYQANCD